jgi:hypothetical protein
MNDISYSKIGEFFKLYNKIDSLNYQNNCKNIIDDIIINDFKKNKYKLKIPKKCDNLMALDIYKKYCITQNIIDLLYAFPNKHNNKYLFVIHLYSNDINWYKICKIKNLLSEEYIIEFKLYIIWSDICKYQKLSIIFMHQYNQHLDFDKICQYQHLTEMFIDTYKNKINWEKIYKYQMNNLSDYFILINFNKFSHFIIME